MSKQLMKSLAVGSIMFAAMGSQAWAQDEALKKCLSDNGKARNETVNAYNKHQGNSMVTKDEVREWTTKRNEIQAKHKAYEKDGITLAECQQMLKDNQSLTALMLSMIAPPVMPEKKKEPVKMTAEQKKILAECKAKLEKTQDETDKRYKDAKKAGKISAAEEKKYKEELDSWNGLYKKRVAEGYDHNDCLLMAKWYTKVQGSFSIK